MSMTKSRGVGGGLPLATTTGICSTRKTPLFGGGAVPKDPPFWGAAAPKDPPFWVPIQMKVY